MGSTETEVMVESIEDMEDIEEEDVAELDPIQSGDIWKAGTGEIVRQNGHRDIDGAGEENGHRAREENGEGETELSLKRVASQDLDMSVDEADLSSKRRKTGALQPKNPISTLNELRPGLVYKTLAMDGPSHAPLFTVSVELNGKVYEGTGRSKKHAKHAAAEATLHSLQFTSDNSEAGFGASSTPADVTTSTRQVEGDGGGVSSAATSTPSRHPALSQSGPSQTSKNPIMLLNELRQGVEYLLKQECGEPHAKTFTFQVTVDTEIFQGTGNSKKLAKTAAARQALSKLYGVTDSSPAAVLNNVLISNMPNIHMPQTLADKIATLVCDKFSELTSDNPVIAKRKVLAGIVMTNDDDEDDIKVIGLSTGTKCINGEHFNLQGQCINDCHAEIVARRCLVHFLYSQLERLGQQYAQDSTVDTIFEEAPDTKGFRVRPHYKFHLYITTAPCGDARIFAPHEGEGDRTDRHPNRQSRGLLRTKIESGEGTMPVKAGGDNIQTWDGVLHGERLLTMSCSDKIACWNAVGLQGALLSHFLSPIYLESIVLGSLFNATHMYRAVRGRIEQTIEGLPPPFQLNQPKMSQGSSTESRQPQKAPTIAVNWDCEDNVLEILNTMTGQPEGENFSRLCKRTFLERFCELVNHLPISTEVEAGAMKSLSYGELKALAVYYQASKKAMVASFSQAGLGMWITKPIEGENFYL